MHPAGKGRGLLCIYIYASRAERVNKCLHIISICTTQYSVQLIKELTVKCHIITRPASNDIGSIHHHSVHGIGSSVKAAAHI